MVDNWVQLRALFGRAAGDPRGTLRGWGPRRGRILPADALYYDTAIVAHHVPHLGSSDPRFTRRFRPDVHHEHVGRPELHRDTSDHPVHLRAGLHPIQGRLSRRDVVRVLRDDTRLHHHAVRVGPSPEEGSLMTVT